MDDKVWLAHYLHKRRKRARHREIEREREMAMALGGQARLCQHPCSSLSQASSFKSSCAALPLSLGSMRVQRHNQMQIHLIRSSVKPVKNGRQGRKQETRLLSEVALPALALAALYSKEVITVHSDWRLSERSIKDLYMFISIAFCWGCCVFGSMNDPFYDSDEYRDAGGNGTQFWMYDREEVEEEEAREELWRDDLVKEIESKVEEMRELEDADKEKQKELV